MRAAIALRDVVGEAQHLLVVGIVPPHGDFNRHAVFFTADINRLVQKRFLALVDIFHELHKPAVIVQLMLHHVRMTAVGELDANAGIEEGEFAQAALQRIEIEFDHAEGIGRGQEADFRTRLRTGITGYHERGIGHAMGKAHLMNLAGTTDLQLQPDRQRVHNRNANSVQTTGNLVGILVELTTGVKLGHDDLGR